MWWRRQRSQSSQLPVFQSPSVVLREFELSVKSGRHEDLKKKGGKTHDYRSQKAFQQKISRPSFFLGMTDRPISKWVSNVSNCNNSVLQIPETLTAFSARDTSWSLPVHQHWKKKSFAFCFVDKSRK